MTSVVCEQLRYTWAERRLDGAGPGFGIVLRSRHWPDELEADPELWQLLTELSLPARRMSDVAPQTFVTHLRRAGGALLIAKRPVGTDGAGRPGNYCVHALFDPTATLGAMDLEPLLADGSFSLDRDLTAAPRADAERVQVQVPEAWAKAASSRRRSSTRVPAEGSAVLRHWDLEELQTLLGERCQTMPADLVNQLEAVGGQEAGGTRVADSGADQQPDADELYRTAVQLGAVRQAWWWERRGLPRASWDVELGRFLVLHQPVHTVPDTRLWERWDHSSATGRAAIANELLDRPALVDDEEATAAVGSRRSLIDDVIEAGLTANGQRGATAARWVAEVGSDAQVVDFTAELLAARPATQLPSRLVHRLAEQPPGDLPPRLVEAVASTIDGDVPTAWRLLVLQTSLCGAAATGASRALADGSSDNELVDALRLALGGGADLDQCWHQLGDLVPAGRRDRAFAATSAESAEHLLRHASATSSRGDWPTLWRLLAVSSGWSPVVRDLIPSARRREKRLQNQRLVLLITTTLLAATTLVLLLLLRLT